MNKKIIFRIILWYGLLTLGVGFILNIMTMINLYSNNELSISFIFLLFLLINVFYMIIYIELLRAKLTRIRVNFILFYWISQIVFFGFLGNSYAFSTGPNLSIYIKYIDSIEIGFITRYWTQEFTFKFNTISDRIYFGLNTIPLLITILLIYVSPATAGWCKGNATISR